jgi:polysaccharide biosynthesis transport protein
LKDVTSDRDATFEWLRSELAKTKSEGTSLSKRVASITASISDYQARSSRLSEAQIEQQALLRKVKTAEDNYLLYKKKTEEAHINDELDQHGMMNAAVVDRPSVPRLPVVSPVMYLAGGLLLGFLFAVSAAFVADRLDRTFRTPEEVSNLLGLPVLAVFPLQADRISLPMTKQAS